MSQSRTSFAGSNFGGNDDQDEEKEKKRKMHPYDNVFGKKVNINILKNDHAIAKITLQEFEKIKW